MNQRKCSCSLSLSRSSLRVAGVPQTQPPSLNGSLPRRAESTRHGALHLPGSGPLQWSGVAAVPTFVCLGPSFDQAPPTRPHREAPPCRASRRPFAQHEHRHRRGYVESGVKRPAGVKRLATATASKCCVPKMAARATIIGTTSTGLACSTAVNRHHSSRTLSGSQASSLAGPSINAVA